MKTSVILTTNLFILLTLAIPSQAEEKNMPIFNGKDLKGWQGMQGEAKNWGVKDGALSGSGGEGAEWLATTGEYDDFDLTLEFNLPKDGNSGVFIRAPKEGTPYVDGMEIQLLDDYGEKWKDLKPDQFTGAIYAVMAPTKRVTKPAGQWQTMRILCVGKKCQVWVNGEQIIDADLDELSRTHGEKVPGLKRDNGLIGLQNHGDPVSFRNIHIREAKGSNCLTVATLMVGERTSSSTSPSGRSLMVSSPATGARVICPRSRSSTTLNSMGKPASPIPPVGAATVESISAAHRTATRNRNFHPATRRSWTMGTVTTRRAAFTR